MGMFSREISPHNLQLNFFKTLNSLQWPKRISFSLGPFHKSFCTGVKMPAGLRSTLGVKSHPAKIKMNGNSRRRRSPPVWIWFPRGGECFTLTISAMVRIFLTNETFYEMDPSVTRLRGVVLHVNGQLQLSNNALWSMTFLFPCNSNACFSQSIICRVLTILGII